ncbi:DUF370 domain-containing protein [Thermotalea metallivorans]|uniref:DUF370 domain-containing protein n=1 Tax=Thermotalea metallivorans TaxID=520762 RepID=A0A140LCJ5_9FIRM|nr:DUF370 domain-containing protein [Thermotalea metallivorans]KXG78270.1 hypothetical protein AN619_02450 [Thermotalea metallivorans]
MMIHVGYGNYVEASKILAITGIESAPLRRQRQHAADRNKLIDCTMGRAANSLVHLVDGYIVASASKPDTLLERTMKSE